MKPKTALSENFKKELGKYLLDVSKLIFGGAIIAGIMKENVEFVYVLSVGFLAFVTTAAWGLYLIYQPQK